MNVIYVGVSNKNLTFVKLPVNCNKLIRLLHTEHNEKSLNPFDLPLWSSILLSLESDADDALASAIITKKKKYLNDSKVFEDVCKTNAYLNFRNFVIKWQDFDIILTK